MVMNEVSFSDADFKVISFKLSSTIFHKFDEITSFSFPYPDCVGAISVLLVCFRVHTTK